MDLSIDRKFLSISTISLSHPDTSIDCFIVIVDCYCYYDLLSIIMLLTFLLLLLLLLLVVLLLLPLLLLLYL